MVTSDLLKQNATILTHSKKQPSHHHINLPVYGSRPSREDLMFGNLLRSAGDRDLTMTERTYCEIRQCRLLVFHLTAYRSTESEKRKVFNDSTHHAFLNHFSTTGLLCCDHRVRHSQRLYKKIHCVTSNHEFNSTTSFFNRNVIIF